MVPPKRLMVAAEARLATEPPGSRLVHSPEALLHELQVHQIELEMQNEELHRTKMAIEVERERLFNLYDLAPVGYCTLSENGLILEANQTASTLLGLAQDALEQQPMTSFVFGEDQDIYSLFRRQTFETGEPQSCELRMVKKNGTIFWTHLAATATEAADGSPICRIMLSDSPERDRTEAALRESEETYRALFDSMLNGFAYCRMLFKNGEPEDFTYLAVNPAFEVQTGLKNVVGKKVSEVIPGIRESDPKLFKVYGRVAMTGHPERFEMFIEALQMWFSISLYSPKAEHFVAVFDVITERKNAEERLTQLLHEQKVILDSEIVGIVKVRNRILVWANHAFEKMLGYSPGELVGIPTRHFYASQAEFDAMGAKAYPVMQAGGNFQGEAQYLHKDGHTLWLSFTSAFLDIETGDSLGAFFDITERKRAEEEFRKLAQAVEQSPESIIITNLAAEIEYVNEAFVQTSGYRREEVLGKNPRLLNSGKTPRQSYDAMWDTLKHGKTWQGELENRRKDGSDYTDFAIITPIRQADGRISHYVAVQEDITERKGAEAELRRLNRTLKMSSECNQALVHATEETQLLDTVCRRMTEIGGYIGVWVGYAVQDEARTVRPVTLVGMPDDEFAAALNHLSWADTKAGCGPTGTAIRTGQVVVTHDFQTDPHYEPWRDVAIRLGAHSAASFPLKAQGKVLGAISMYAGEADAFDDQEVTLLRELADDLAYGITALREAAERRRAEEALLLSRHALESTNDGIMITDSSLPDRAISYVNPAFERITGYTVAEVVGRNARFLLGQDKDQLGLEELRSALREQRAAKVELRNFRKDGRVFWSELSLAPVRSETGQVRHFVSIINDITERKIYETQLEYQAGHDPLTGLPNRNLLADRLEQAIAHAKRAKSLVAVLLLDLDRFKMVNDSLGHDVGDALLKIVSKRLTNCVRSIDTVARLGGDEFVVIMTDIESENNAAPLAQKLLDDIAQPMMLGDREIVTNASIGISLYPKDAERASALLKSADVAMYRAKELGRNSMQFYTSELNASTLARLELDAALRRALERDELVLYYQPKVELQRGQVVGAEALIRWRHPFLGMVSPGDFIPLAEETGLIMQIGEWVINTACAQLKAWQTDGWPDLSLAVNLSARQFQQRDLANVVANALRLNDVQAKFLELEVTESAVMQNPEATVTILRELKQIGVRLSLDDFGTGYSSLNYLKRFPIDILKIDQSFVRDITTDPDDAAIATMVISLAHRLKRCVVAEGVETEGQLNFLRRHRCDEIQGYYFSRPLPADEFARLLREGQSLSLGAKAETGVQRTLLLVDDESNIVSALNRLLRRDGYRILNATSAAEGMELLALNEVQVILSDQRMPEMSGTEFLGRVKEMYPETIRMVLSGYTELTSVTDAINRGAIYKFLTKPWDDDQLREHVREAFIHYEAKKDRQSS